jgi:hypothetical protein
VPLRIFKSRSFPRLCASLSQWGSTAKTWGGGKLITPDENEINDLEEEGGREGARARLLRGSEFIWPIGPSVVFRVCIFSFIPDVVCFALRETGISRSSLSKRSRAERASRRLCRKQKEASALCPARYSVDSLGSARPINKLLPFNYRL